MMMMIKHLIEITFLYILIDITFIQKSQRTYLSQYEGKGVGVGLIYYSDYHVGRANMIIFIM
jgi:hypothetical protein